MAQQSFDPTAAVAKIKSDPEYLSLGPGDRRALLEDIFNQGFANDPDIEKISRQDLAKFKEETFRTWDPAWDVVSKPGDMPPPFGVSLPKLSQTVPLGPALFDPRNDDYLQLGQGAVYELGYPLTKVAGMDEPTPGNVYGDIGRAAGLTGQIALAEYATGGLATPLLGPRALQAAKFVKTLGPAEKAFLKVAGESTARAWATYGVSRMHGLDENESAINAAFSYFPLLGEGAKKAFVAAGNKLESSLYNFVIKTLPKEFRLHRDPGFSIAKEKLGIPRNLEHFKDMLNSRIDELMDSLESKLFQPRGGKIPQVDLDDLVAKVNQSTAKSVSEQGNDKLRDHVQAVGNELAKEIKTEVQTYITKEQVEYINTPLGKYAPAVAVLDLKRKIGRTIKTWASGEVAEDAEQALRREAYRIIDDALDSVHPDVASLNDRVSGLIGGVRSISHLVDLKKANEVKNWLQSAAYTVGAAGGVGYWSREPLTAIAAAIPVAVLQTTPGKVMAAKLARVSGDALGFMTRLGGKIGEPFGQFGESAKHFNEQYVKGIGAAAVKAYQDATKKKDDFWADVKARLAAMPVGTGTTGR